MSLNGKRKRAETEMRLVWVGGCVWVCARARVRACGCVWLYASMRILKYTSVNGYNMAYPDGCGCGSGAALYVGCEYTKGARARVFFF